MTTFERWQLSQAKRFLRALIGDVLVASLDSRVLLDADIPACVALVMMEMTKRLFSSHSDSPSRKAG